MKDCDKDHDGEIDYREFLDSIMFTKKESVSPSRSPVHSQVHTPIRSPVNSPAQSPFRVLLGD